MRQPVPFGKYVLLERISVGGMAEVFKAKSFGVEGFEKIIAIKRILPSMSEDGEFIQMFIDEAKIAGQLSHANICQIFELGKIGDNHFIAMEYIWGKDLLQIHNRFRKLRQKMPLPMACAVAAKVCEGLDYAHRKKDALGRPLQIIHRDVSPQNVLVSYEGEVKIIDFGIAKAAVRSSRTQAGVLKGKFGYMSPEQVRGLPLDRRSDLFAIGTLLYECLTGERLFQNDSDFSTLERVRNAEVESPRKLNPKISPDLEAIVMKALARNVEDRYQWANELQDDLQGLIAKTDPVFTAKQLAAWMKDAFAQDLARERQLLEAYKKLTRASLPPDPAESSGDEVFDNQPGEEATQIGGPSFDDMLAGSGKPGQGFAEEAPTEVYGDITPGKIPSLPTQIIPDRHGHSQDGVVRSPMPSVDMAVPQVHVGLPTEPLMSSGAPPMPLRSPPSLPHMAPLVPTAAPIGPLSISAAGAVTGLPIPPLDPSPGLPITAPPSLPGVPAPPDLVALASGSGGPMPQVTPTGLSAAAPLTPPMPYGSNPGSSISARMPRAVDPSESTLLRDIAIGAGAAVLVAATIAGAYFLGTRVLVRHAPSRPPPAATTTLFVATGDSGDGEVFIDGARKGTIHGGEPLAVEALQPGEVDLVIKRNGVPDCAQRVVVEHRPRVTTCRFQVTQTTGTVMLTVVTEGAVVLVDDQEISADAAREPIILSADAHHTISVKKDLFLTQTIPISLHPGEVAVQRVELEPAPAPPPGKPTSHAHEHHDRTPASRPVESAPPKEPELNTPADPGGFLVADSKPWAKVLVDGHDTGKMTPIFTRAKIPISAGKHVVTFDYNGQRFSYTIMVEPGQDYFLQKQLPVGGVQ